MGNAQGKDMSGSAAIKLTRKAIKKVFQFRSTARINSSQLGDNHSVWTVLSTDQTLEFSVKERTDNFPILKYKHPKSRCC